MHKDKPNDSIMERYAIIVAGGSGSRFGSTVPKQFVTLAGKPLLMHTIDAFNNYDNSIKIIVALPSEHITLWNDLCRQYDFKTPHSIAAGGKSRFESVRNALSAIHGNDGIVAVHDGARPLATEALIKKGYATAEMCGSAIPAIAVTNSIRQLDRQGSHPVNRETLVAVQTPQVFDLKTLKEAYTADYSPLFTDDASVVEFSGHPVTLYDGDPGNIKITRPIDLKIAETIIAGREG